MGLMGNERIEEAAAVEPLRNGEARPSSGHRAMVVEDLGRTGKPTRAASVMVFPTAPPMLRAV